MKHKRLQLARKRKKLNTQRMASQLHKSASTIRAWESDTGSEPKLRDAARLCELLGITLDWYVTGREPMAPLTDEEQQLITQFRQLPPATKQAILALLGSLPVSGQLPLL